MLGCLYLLNGCSRVINIDKIFKKSIKSRNSDKDRGQYISNSERPAILINSQTKEAAPR